MNIDSDDLHYADFSTYGTALYGHGVVPPKFVGMPFTNRPRSKDGDYTFIPLCVGKNGCVKYYNSNYVDDGSSTLKKDYDKYIR